MAFVDITASQTDAKSPIDVQLMDVGLNQNLDSHEARILALEAGSGSGGGSSDPALDPRYGSIVAGFQTNEAKFKRRRYDVFQNFVNNGEKIINPESFDPTGEDDSFYIYGSDHVSYTYDNDTNHYNNYAVGIPQGNTVMFKLKKGYNFFGIGYLRAAGNSDSVNVFIDGQSITTFGGITDETGSAQTDSFTPLDTELGYQHVQWYFGLDGEEHTITLENDDSGSAPFHFDFVEIGFASKHGTFSIDRELKISDGRVNVRGSVVSTNETDVTFDALSGYGRTDALVVNTSGTISTLKGVEAAMTQATADINFQFSTSLTTFYAKNAYYFPSSGFLLVSHPGGEHYIASYTGKTTSTAARHSFDGVLWASKPKEDYTPETNFESLSAGDPTGSININLWAQGGHVISSSNNKLDFKVTLNGVQTTHAATIANGLYSADIMPLGRAIVNAMKAVKPLTSGEYFCEYNSDAQRWIIGVRGHEVSELQLLFSTGSNFANSIHSTIGYSNTDLTGDNSYLAQSEVQSLAHRVFDGGEFIAANDPRIQVNYPDSGSDSPFSEFYENRMGLGYVKSIQQQDPMIKIYPDPDACGLSFTFGINDGGSMIVAQVDYGNQIYILRTEFSSDGGQFYESAMTGFVSFPKGSKVISLWQLSDAAWEVTDNTNNIKFLGARQFFTKPKVEALTTNQAIIKSFEINPYQLFVTRYGSNYTPAGTFDNIDTITYNGTWTNGTGDWFNGNNYNTSTLNDYVDITFTLSGNGGGIGIGHGVDGTSVTRKAAYYLVSGASGSETNTLIQNHYFFWPFATATSGERFQIVGLPSGQYTLRVKNLYSGGFLVIDSIAIYDTVMPDRGQVVSDLNNNHQAVSYPMNFIKFPTTLSSYHLVPPYLHETGYNEGKSFYDYRTENISISGLNLVETNDVKQNNLYYSYVGFLGSADFIRSFYFCKSALLKPASVDSAGNSASVLPVIDGVNHSASFSTRLDTKAGDAATTAPNYHPLFCDHFLRYGTSMSNSTTLPISNTRGLKVGRTVILEADSQTTLKRTIATVTADTNITFTEAVSGFANYTTANNVRVRAYGFHSIKFENNDVDTVGLYVTAFGFEPLDIRPSNHEQRRLAKSKIGEVASITFKLVANGNDLYYPYFSDGRQATYSETSIDILAVSSSGATYSFPYDLKDIVLSAGTIDVKLTSIRKF